MDFRVIMFKTKETLKQHGKQLHVCLTYGFYAFLQPMEDTSHLLEIATQALLSRETFFSCWNTLNCTLVSLFSAPLVCNQVFFPCNVLEMPAVDWNWRSQFSPRRLSQNVGHSPTAQDKTGQPDACCGHYLELMLFTMFSVHLVSPLAGVIWLQEYQKCLYWDSMPSLCEMLLLKWFLLVV